MTLAEASTHENPGSGFGRNPLQDYRRFVIEAWAAYIAVTIGLFEALVVPRTLDALAAENAWTPSALRALLRALVACGHVVTDERGQFALADRSRALFLPSSDAYIGHALSFMRTTPAYLRYADILQGAEAVGLSETQWSYVTRGSAMYATAGVQVLLQNFPELWRRQPLRILDVGCGQGAYLAQLARALPHAKLLGIDPTARVVEDAKARLADFGEAAPEVVVATLEHVTGTFDAILFNQVFHVTGIEVATQLLRLSRERLTPGGRVFVQEILDDGADPSPALFGLNMRMLFEHGCALTTDEQTELLRQCGFAKVEVHPIGGGSTPGLAYVSGEM